MDIGILSHDSYVDDLMSGAPDVITVIDTQQNGVQTRQNFYLRYLQVIGDQRQ